MRKLVSGAAVAAMALVAVAPAASAGEAHGRCNTSDGRQWADFSVTYITNGSYDHMNNWWWTISGTDRNKNNVAAQVKEAVSQGTPPVVASWKSGDDVHAGQGHQPINGTMLPRSKTYYGAFQFVFDIEGGDPSCKGKTTSF